MNASKSTVVFEDTDYASGQRRLIAVVIDLCVCFTLMAIPMLIATYLWVAPEHQVKLDDAAKQRRLVFEDIGAPRYYATVTLSVLLPFFYQIGMRQTWDGTLGYRIARIRLIGLDGSPPSLVQVGRRTLFSLLAFFTLGAVFIPTFRWKKRQALHDRLAGTWMVLARSRPAGPGQVIYKTKLFGTYPVTFSDIEPLEVHSEDASDSDPAVPVDPNHNPAS